MRDASDEQKRKVGMLPVLLLLLENISGQLWALWQPISHPSAFESCIREDWLLLMPAFEVLKNCNQTDELQQQVTATDGVSEHSAHDSGRRKMDHR